MKDIMIFPLKLCVNMCIMYECTDVYIHIQSLSKSLSDVVHISC